MPVEVTGNELLVSQEVKLHEHDVVVNRLGCSVSDAVQTGQTHVSFGVNSDNEMTNRGNSAVMSPRSPPDKLSVEKDSASTCAMPAYKPTKEDYILELQSLGEDPPEDWTVMEIKTRLHEIKEAQGMCLQTNGKKTTPFRVLVIEMNKCSKKKALLQEFAKSKMMLPISGHETIPRLQQMCLQKIYETTPATPQDPAGFGMHCSLTYEEIFLNEPDYAKWVMQTAMEGQADHRLRCLANWLEDRPQGASQEDHCGQGQGFQDQKDGRGFHRLERQLQLERGLDGDDSQSAGGGGSTPRGATPQTCREVRRPDVDGLFPHGLALSEREPNSQAGVVPTCQYNIDVDLTLEEKWTPLPEQKARQLSFQADEMLPEVFGSLVSHGRLKLLEVACSHDSTLTETMQRITKNEMSARRCSLFNGFDLSTDAGVRKVIHEIDKGNPEHVWLSPVCGPYSVMQTDKSKNTRAV